VRRPDQRQQGGRPGDGPGKGREGVQGTGLGAGEGGARADGAEQRHPGQAQAQTADGQQPDGHREPGQDDGDPGQQGQLVALAEGADGELLEPLRGGVDGRPADHDQRRRLAADKPRQQLGHAEGGPAGQQPGQGADATPARGPGSRAGGRRDRVGAHAPGSEPPGRGIGLDPAWLG
jgi:hypothetical protein